MNAYTACHQVVHCSFHSRLRIFSPLLFLPFLFYLSLLFFFTLYENARTICTYTVTRTIFLIRYKCRIGSRRFDAPEDDYTYTTPTAFGGYSVRSSTLSTSPFFFSPLLPFYLRLFFSAHARTQTIFVVRDTVCLHLWLLVTIIITNYLEYSVMHRL